ncbi:MAG: hydrogenase nickel incorporation protein HypB, partial [Candidatus Eremiobacteraeota bacterium]|nr:hydrogenase nickel incorporation protein HypB [Candidatus Eremiobacteraeota bacterium]
MTYRLVEVQKSVLSKNAGLARDLRQRFAESGTFVLNLLSSPGAGKTTLLEETLRRLASTHRAAALVGDQATDNDSLRLARAKVAVRQITTGAECRLDALMVGKALDGWALADYDLLCIENVGNLICPAEYDLGEDLRVTLMSVTEGEDKPLKYPLAFNTAQTIIITKIDLSSATGFDRAAARANIERVHPGVQVIELSARSGQGRNEWLELVEQSVQAKRVAAP